MQINLESQISNSRKRKPKESYSCSPCRRLKLKCDHKRPCSSCMKSNRVEECLQNPAKSLTQFKELIKPNTSFGKIKKTMVPTRSKSLMFSSSFDSNSFLIDANSGELSINSIQAPYHGPQFLQSHVDNNSINLIDQNKFLNRRIEELNQRIEELSNHLNYQSYLNSSPKFVDVYQMDQHKIDLLKSFALKSILPPKDKVDFLKEYFIIHSIDQGHTIHIPTFENQYNIFWSMMSNPQAVVNIDPLWVSLLFAILATSMVFIPASYINSNPVMAQYFQNEEFSSPLHASWFKTSRQILLSYVDHSKPTRLIQLQLFSIYKIYLIFTNQLNLLDKLLAQSVMDCYQLQLYSPISFNRINFLEAELRKRLWWDICSYDTERALCLKRRPLIQSNKSNVPFPGNCDDIELNEKSCSSKELQFFTDCTFSIFQAKIFKIVNEIFNIYDEENEELKFKVLYSIDKRLYDIETDLPPYFKLKTEEIKLSSMARSVIFQGGLIQTELSIHRFRLYESYLKFPIDTTSIPMKVCQSTINSLFIPFKIFLSVFQLNKEPGFHLQLHKLLAIIIIHLSTLATNVLNNELSKQDSQAAIDFIMRMLSQRDLYITPRCLANNLELLIDLKLRADRVSSSPDQQKMNINSLIIEPGLITKRQSLVYNKSELSAIYNDKILLNSTLRQITQISRNFGDTKFQGTDNNLLNKNLFESSIDYYQKGYVVFGNL
ncbi:hypothetical protein WICMUC_004412 [Wickerhamomyces mucosus]|uniref:Zn(2)-C6 fungal-type domain-containing protein n=1 Tax=Wickerhamomyces mucosus TaxID=1378264 RepID=A0A9P8TA92_9ASCO|nr:hypothetical protein WICMUC_004412 [Wickerhamomyces mucosus]